MSEVKKKRKGRIKKERIRMSIQDPRERIRNFDEVTLGFSKEEAIAEATR